MPTDKAVSYTHLDVYKRQGYPFPMLATELFAKEQNGKDKQNGQHFSLGCYAVKRHF